MGKQENENLAKRRQGRVLNDVHIKTFNPLAKGAAPTIRKGKRVYLIHGTSTKIYYDSSDSSYRISAIRMDLIVSLTELAICFYNIKEHTNFTQVKVLKVVRAMSGVFTYYITFEAFSPPGVASVFETRIVEYLGNKIEIMSVSSHSHHKGKSSKEDLPPNIPQQQTLSDDSLNYLALYLSQFALTIYNESTLHAKKDAVHDIPSVKVVKAMKHDAPSLKVVKGKKHNAEGTTYLVTFEAPLRDESKNVEIFETQICVLSLFPTMIIKFKEIQRKHE